MARINETDVEINMSKDVYKLKQKWPVDVYIQVGASGVVLSKKGGYKTAFFEAFPLNTFIRGESGRDESADSSEKTVDELLTIAENKAWEKYQRFLSCEANGGHEYVRLLDDGYAECKRCGIKHSGVLENVVKCGCCGKEPAFYEFSDKDSVRDNKLCLEHYYKEMMSYDFYNKETYFEDDGHKFIPDFFNSNGKINDEYRPIMIDNKLSLLQTFKDLKIDVDKIDFDSVNENEFYGAFKNNEKLLLKARDLIHKIISNNIDKSSFDNPFELINHINEITINKSYDEFVFDLVKLRENNKELFKKLTGGFEFSDLSSDEFEVVIQFNNYLRIIKSFL